MSKTNTYEGMFLVEAGKSDFQAANEPVQTVLARSDAEILSIKPWDERRLAFEIKGRRRALYILTYFRADPQKITEIERDCQLNEGILREIIFRREVLKDEEIHAETPAMTRWEEAVEAPAEPAAAKPDQPETAETPAPPTDQPPATDETPAEAPAETPAEAPAEAPAETPAEAPAEAPAETPAEVPAETPAETPAEAPAETPAEAPADTPAEAPAEVPSEPAEALPPPAVDESDHDKDESA